MTPLHALPDWLEEIETELARVESETRSDSTFHAVRRLASHAMQRSCNGEVRDQSFGDSIDDAAKCPDVAMRRQAALLILRLFSVSGCVPENPQINRSIVELVERGVPDIVRQLNLAARRQLYEKLDAIREVHQAVCLMLSRLTTKMIDPERLVASRTEFLKSLSDPLLGSYLSLYEFSYAKDSIRVLLTKLADLMSANDQTFARRLVELRSTLTADMARYAHRSDFLSRRYIHPFLTALSVALVTMEGAAQENFVCDLHPKRKEPDIAEKRYPLHEKNRQLKVAIVLVNDGPGFALDVQAEISTAGQSLAFDDRLLLGDIQPGPFLLTFEVLVLEPVDRGEFAINLSWKEGGAATRKERIFDLLLVGQEPNVDWPALELQQPYSTEVAEGEEFVGRKSKLTSLASRFLNQRMVSSFITGQKRVGKTSLARAIENYVLNSTSFNEFEFNVLYLEYGSYSRMDPVETVTALGTELAAFLIKHLPSPSDANGLDFRGSLAPLSRLADILSQAWPKRRFILILDEFDEIHPEMYRFGALAESFFANLRALSAKKNMAFLLVGGEKMPFIMSAQGDQLNRFVREQLDYFSKLSEWDDFLELVRKPTKQALNWDEGAVDKVFELTNGHPFYTKVLCNKVYVTAVSERDTEVTAREVTDAARRVVRELAGNAFAHIWKDGIQQEGKDAEVVELRRRRVLCAGARALRESMEISVDAIAKHKSGLRLSGAEIVPQLNDFVRREFAVQQHETYRLTIPLFRDWLVEYGVSQLMSDTLAEEYETLVERAEEEAYVTPAEITDLVKRWHIYRGQTVSAETVRAWLDQVRSKQEQRLLFKLLQHVRFFSASEVREKLRQAHGMLAQYLRPFVQHKRIDRRNDVLVTYVDGVAKSGARFADYYAEENRISSRCVVPPDDLGKRIKDQEERTSVSVSAIVLVDDFVGSGQSLIGNLSRFFERNRRLMRERNLRLFVVAVACTRDGDEAVRGFISRTAGLEVEFRVCEFVRPTHFAFGSDSGIWNDSTEMEKAKALCLQKGSLVHRENPLGFAGQGLLLTFPENCPNNSLPLLHSTQFASDGWWPIFPRAKN